MRQMLLVQGVPEGAVYRPLGVEEALSGVGKGSFWPMLPQSMPGRAWKQRDALRFRGVPKQSSRVLRTVALLRGSGGGSTSIDDRDGRRKMKPRVAGRRVLFCRCRTVSACRSENADCGVCLEMAKGGWDIQERRPCGRWRGEGGCRGSVGTCLLTARELSAKGLRSRFPVSEMAGGL